jgi:hypothetical protein
MFLYLFALFMVPPVRSSVFRIAVQSSNPSKTKKTSSPLIIQRTTCLCTSRPLFRQTGLQEMREPHILFLADGFWSPRWFRIAALEFLQRILKNHIEVRQPVGRKYTIQGDLQRINGLHLLRSGLELKTPYENLSLKLKLLKHLVEDQTKTVQLYQFQPSSLAGRPI